MLSVLRSRICENTLYVAGKRLIGLKSLISAVSVFVEDDYRCILPAAGNLTSTMHLLNSFVNILAIDPPPLILQNGSGNIVLLRSLITL